MKIDMLQKALAIRAKGWSIIPVSRKAKTPLLSWKKYTQELATRKQIKRWWKEYPDANIGIVTGKISNLTVVDIEEGGDYSYLPETKTVSTGGNGFHFYYQYSDSVTNAVRIKELTDIRNNGGYVVAPPSLHSSGKRYKWKTKVKITPFPVELFHKELVEQGNTDWDEILEGAGSGSRNEKAAKVCGLFLTKTPYKLWEKLAWPAVKDWNQRNRPPMTETELRSVFESISQRAKYHREDSEREIFTLSSLTKKHRKEIQNRKNGIDDLVPSGLDSIDASMNGGFRKGDLILIGARPSVGKTALALSIAYNAAKKGKHVLFFSIEMDAIDIYDRLLAFALNERCSNIIKGDIKRKKLKIGYKRMKKLPFSIAELAKATSDEVIDVVKEHLISNKIDLIVVDYLQFLRDKPDSNGNDNQRVGKISKNLKMLARITNIPVISPVQLTRNADGKSPQLKDLRDSGNLEADADIVFLLHRLQDQEKRDRAELHIAKNRKGETNKTFLKFDVRTTRYTSSRRTTI